MLFRLILLLAIAGGLTIFALSNGSTLALIFLGMQTPALPLSLWVLGAIAVGAMTHLLIAALFRLSNLLVATEVRSQVRRTERRRDTNQQRGSSQRPMASDDADWQNWEGYEDPVDRQSSRARTGVKASALIDDWEGDFKDDWQDEPPSQPRPKSEPRPSPSPSAYNYSPPHQAPGRAETQSSPGSVVDADFRVLVPPTRSTPEPTPQPNNADDWFEDDDLETDAERSRRLGL